LRLYIAEARAIGAEPNHLFDLDGRHVLEFSRDPGHVSILHCRDVIAQCFIGDDRSIRRLRDAW
jgi:hypothetical protein